MGNEPGRQAAPSTASIQSMDENLQKKFSKGIQYNSRSPEIILCKLLIINCILFRAVNFISMFKRKEYVKSKKEQGKTN